MKHTLLFIIILCFIVILTSCGNNYKSKVRITEDQEETLAPASEIVIGDGVDYHSYFNTTFQNLIQDTSFTYTIENNQVTITGYIGNNTKVQIPDTIENKPVTKIADFAFENASLHILYIPSSIQTIGKNIFKNVTTLQALRVPFVGNTAKENNYLGYLFGSETYELNARDVPDSLQILSIGTWDIPQFCLYDCNDLVLVNLEESKNIATYAFYGCSNLKTILGTQKCQTIADYAFRKCSNLLYLTFSESLQSIGLGVLEDCDNLQELTLPFIGQTATQNSYLSYIFGAEYVDYSKDYYSKKLYKINLLSSCKIIPNYAFYECETLAYITCPNIESIGVRSFWGCKNLREISFPSSLVSISENAFMYCIYLSQITFSEGLQSIGINAFYHCVSLLSITLPDTLTSIPNSCFAECYHLTTVHLGQVKQIGNNAFYACYRIGKVTTSLNNLSEISISGGNTILSEKIN